MCRTSLGKNDAQFIFSSVVFYKCIFEHDLSAGCHECQCHGHAEESLNFCDNQTGQCHCKDNTDGNNCEKCAAGFYGNPR